MGKTPKTSTKPKKKSGKGKKLIRRTVAKIPDKYFEPDVPDEF